MNELYFDILRDGTSDECTVVLLGYRNGACPIVRHISPEDFLLRLRNVLSWPAETIERIYGDLRDKNKAVNERLGLLSIDQLEELGFVGL